jgi:tetratricopeptide (TPR) repeat protein
MIAGFFHILISESILAYNNNIKGYIAMHLGTFNKAEKYFQKSLFYSPKYSKALLNMGIVSMHKNEYETARHYFHTVLEKEPDNETAMLQLGCIHKNEKKGIMHLFSLKEPLQRIRIQFKHMRTWDTCIMIKTIFQKH